MHFVQQRENRHRQFGGFSSGLSQEFQEAQWERESSSAEQYVLHKDHSIRCQLISFVVHKQSTWWLTPGWSICTCGSSAKFFPDYTHWHNSTVNGTWCYHPMEYQNGTFTLSVLIKCQHKAIVWCSVSWQWSGKTVHNE